mmetsp:Transcript_28054/g.42445  ORF Transcript_28054/g.42445 Transcript_28054/m.42445 type:complete len:504 (+) Transcript_28054:2-1513(+)|eukprot:CAMPEP_0178900260 /NCGR_PEP_ID=MMETSP0786-20121207/3377_1 /TAXON_ID=186022 /ORGANISM="Thalassionema frauenfeldii, Strain CCMP 1798" /LENGTH=503 /DNA_ID=CAMNT_0020571249 /DNA_START=259 /DNA_END=1770 /DNA_ORIENTATION=+
MTSYQASLCAVDSQQDKEQAIQQSQLQQLKQNMLMTVDGQRTGVALPISVTASSHPGPSSNGNQEQVELIARQRIQQQMQNSSQKGQVQVDKNGQYHPQTSGVLTNINNTSQTVLVHPYSQMQSQPQARSRSTITLAARLAAPGSGITLPTSIKKSDNLIRKVEKTQAKHTLRNSSGSAETNLLYSSACRASVTQQAALRTLTETNGNSTTGAEPESSKRIGNQVSSTLSQRGKYQKVPVVGGKNNTPICKPMKNCAFELTPQTFLEKLLKSRGYSTQNYCSLDGGYYCKPTSLQKASYGVRIVQSVRQSNPELLEKLLKCGLSPNPCNAFGESIVHMVCRRGDSKLLKVLKDAGCSLQVTDDFGRTPLHDACWTAEPNFETVDIILDTDLRLLNVVDCRGSSPLSYVKRDHWGKWIAYFQSKKEQYWSPRDVSAIGEQPPPPLCNERPNSRPIVDPPHATDLETAQKVAAGSVKPEEIIRGDSSNVRLPLQLASPAAPVPAT